MLNPDGVVLGNSRCSASGIDLNRQWTNPNKDSCPEVYIVKEQIRKIQAKREILVFCDLHGHSMKKHSFLYGCNKTVDGGVNLNELV
jgi:murein tripeptide amidase MpaA